MGISPRLRHPVGPTSIDGRPLWRAVRYVRGWPH